MRKCAIDDCSVRFEPKVRSQRYHTNKCKNRAAARRRAKKIKALLAKEEPQ